MNPKRFIRHPVPPLALAVTLLCTFAVSMFAQGGALDSLPANVENSALFWAQMGSVIVIIIGGFVAAVGNHRAEGIAAMLIGVGFMAKAQQLVQWLFP